MGYFGGREQEIAVVYGELRAERELLAKRLSLVRDQSPSR